MNEANLNAGVTVSGTMEFLGSTARFKGTVDRDHAATSLDGEPVILLRKVTVECSDEGIRELLETWGSKTGLWGKVTDIESVA
jgi:hypothetical protein